MRIAITGASGLLGSNLANYYSDRGHDVFILVKDEFYSVSLNENLNKIYGNVSIKSDVDYFVQKSMPEYFIHLAAQTQAYDSLKYPYNTFYINFVGTLNVLESLREYKKCKSIVIASSDKAYGELDGIEYFESHRLDGIYPYDASKSATDLLSRSYRRTYGMPVVSTRACNMYGVGDSNTQRLIPGIIKAYMDDSVFEVRNGGNDIREYIHVQDVVEAYDHILKFNENPHEVDSFNISSGDRHSTMDIFNMVESAIGKDVDHVILGSPSLEIKKQFMNSSLLKDKTGWFARRTLDSSLKDIVDWYLKSLSII
jgi:CDP-glucose 4,6-dehydratase